jgi:UDP-glucose 4-epimerase
MRVLVTGGAGYIGSITTRALLDAGHECVVLDSLERGFAEAVDPRAEFREGNVGDEVALDLALPSCQAVMHLAGYIEVAESQSDPGKYFRNNAAAPLALLDGMLRHGLTAICYSSTAAVYGQPLETPITEDAPTIPINAYGASKLAFEHELDWYGAAHGVRSIRLRYFNVAGAWPDGSIGEAHTPETHLVPRVLKAMRDGQARFEVYGRDYPTPDGTCVRDYIHVMDLARAHVLGLEALAAGSVGGVYNLGNQRGFTNREVVEVCGEVSGREVEVVYGPRRAGDPAVLVASREKVGRELGWRPEATELREMVEDAWRWHVAHPTGYR